MKTYILFLKWATLVLGFFHLHKEHKVCHRGECKLEIYSSPGVIFLDLAKS
jgi:hypothetical protein